MLRAFLCFFLSLIGFKLLAQDRCGTVEYQKLLQQRHPNQESKEQFELWMQEKLQSDAKQKRNPFNSTIASSYVIPVVIHIVHNGETEGSGTNISDAQILSQIDVLNKDFNRQNADSTKTLSEFASVAGKFPITFVLAKQDPNGAATDGINRVKGPKSTWSMADNYTLKALSYWPAENYLNIWVTNLSGGLLGYTQLPTSSTLQGLGDSSNDRLTDGVVIDYSAFGNVQASGGSNFFLQTEYDLGRTATHEVGHFFGLRHVWGDQSGCTGTDYVADTPPQDTDFNGLCPSGVQVDCSNHAMYSNYLNYTDDACMNIFTKGQVSRMDVVINNSPRRASLLNSLGSQTPIPVANDIELKTIAAPAATACSGTLTPSLRIRNFGSNLISSCQIKLSVNGSAVETKTFSGLNLSPDDEVVVAFSAVTLTAGSTSKFSFQNLQTNSGTDGRAQNDTISIVTRVPSAVGLPLIEPFNTLPGQWSISNPDGLTTWQNVSVGGGNKAMEIDFWNYENSGAVDRLITPVLDLTSATYASLSFDYAYGVLSGGSNDRLRVLVSSNCDFSTSPTVLFNQAGSALATTTPQGSSFTPSSTQWASKIFSLNQFIGQKIQIAFEGTNDYGNNLYLDNVSVLNTAITAFALNGIVSPSPVSCQSSTAPVINVKNLGNTVINSFVVNSYINHVKSTQQLTGVQIDIGASKNVALNAASFALGNNSYSIAIGLPNGVTTGISTKDSLSTNRYVNTATDIIPLRQNFNDGLDAWTSMSPQGGSTWTSASVTSSKKMSLVFDSYSNTSIGEQAWLVSPVLDFSRVNKASLFFETSYGYRAPNAETIQVFSSTDCGETFANQMVLYSGNDLKNADSNDQWTPSQDNQWTKRYLNLDSLVGQENVRLAFVATNANGNNIFIDNIEFFVGDNPSPPSVNGLYSVYGGTGTPLQVTFNLPERQLVRMQIYDVMGHIISDDTLPDMLNQTYTIDSSSQSRGIYIVRVQTQSPASLSSTKVLFGF
ncbi:MAG TPA: choice-of-anchor J domain-containing protein [Cyclobacteriaceae bacterium]|jgi:hypothetical protein|nr:choice-of-anchor J domain-containing protein [Cyclobacteriaceae bacterium]